MLILTIAMNTMLATNLNAQGPVPMTATSNWLAASHATLGANTPANWMMDLDADATELYVSRDHALVIVDRAPIIVENGAAYLREGVHGLGGTHLSLVGEVESISDSVLHGTYSGLLEGTAVLMDQFVQLRNGVPVTIVRAVTRVNGTDPTASDDLEAQVLRLIADPGFGADEPALSRN